jgi:hypothetical protein
MAMSPLLRLFELLKARGLLASLMSGRNHATRKTNRHCSSGRVLARLESKAFFGGSVQTCTKYIYFL